MVKARLCCAYNESLWTSFFNSVQEEQYNQVTPSRDWSALILIHYAVAPRMYTRWKVVNWKRFTEPCARHLFLSSSEVWPPGTLAHLTYGGAGSAASKHSMKRIWKLKVQCRARKESNFCLSSDQGGIHSIFLGWLVRSGWSRLLVKFRTQIMWTRVYL